MKTLIKKTLLVLMVAFIAVFTLGVTNKIKAAEVARFEFGAYDASKTNETNQDGSSASSYTETVGSYTLTLSNMVKVYKGSYDAKGNSCLKLGTGSAKGSFSFTVPADVTKVGILVAGYKAKTVGISINGGTSQTISTTSSNGEYTEVEVDTTTKKTVSFATGTNYRCKINSIVFYTAAADTNPSISIEGGNYTEIDDVVKLTANTANVTGTVAWSSSDTNVATVDQNGNVAAKAFGKTIITATVDEVEDTLEFVVYPTDGSELSVAEAIQVCEYTGATDCPFTYSVTGVIESIDTAYDSSYGNITVTITDGTDSIKAFRMAGGEELIVGDKIKVTGTLVNYNGNTPEFIQGCTYVAVQDDQTTAAAKEALNQINAYMSLAYKYTRDQKEVAAVAESIVMKHSITDTSTNLTAEENNATIVGLDATLFDVATAKNKASNEVGLNKDGTMRLYANAASQKGTSLTIKTLNGQKIVSIEVEFGGTVGNITVNGDAADAAANASYTYLVDSTSVTIQNVTATNIQVWIKSITINLSSSTEVSYVDVFSDVDFRVKCGVDKALGDIKGVESYGIKVTADKEMELSATGEDEDYLFAVISLGDVLTKAQRLDVVFTVQAYVVIDDVTYVSESTKSFSVRQMVEAYYADAATTDLVASLYNLITE